MTRIARSTFISFSEIKSVLALIPIAGFFIMFISFWSASNLLRENGYSVWLGNSINEKKAGSDKLIKVISATAIITVMIFTAMMLYSAINGF